MGMGYMYIYIEYVCRVCLTKGLSGLTPKEPFVDWEKYDQLVSFWAGSHLRRLSRLDLHNIMVNL